MIVDSTQNCSDCEENTHNIKKCHFREISLNTLLMFYWNLKSYKAEEFNFQIMKSMKIY